MSLHAILSREDDYISAREMAADYLATTARESHEARHEALALLIMSIRAEEYLRAFDAARIMKGRES